MEKAYDVKALGQKIADHAKADGLHFAEEAIEKLGKAVHLGVKEWLFESASMTGTPVDDMAVQFVSTFLDAKIDDAISSIDLDKDGQ